MSSQLFIKITTGVSIFFFSKTGHVLESHVVTAWFVFIGSLVEKDFTLEVVQLEV